MIPIKVAMIAINNQGDGPPLADGPSFTFLLNAVRNMATAKP